MPRRNRGAYLKFIRARTLFYIQWSEAGTVRKRSTGTADRREAEAALAEFIRDRHRNERPAGPRDPSEFLIADALDLYGDQHAPNTADPARIAYAMIPLIEFWGDRPIADVTKETCRAYARSRDRAPATVRRELTTMRAAFRFAHSEGRLTRVPVVELPEAPEGKDRWLTTNEAARLLNAARTGRSDVRLYLPLYILIGLYTGARPGAILSMRWPQVDLERGRIDFQPTGGRRTNKRKVRGQPIPERLLPFLRRARQRGTDRGTSSTIAAGRSKTLAAAGTAPPMASGTAVSAARASARALLMLHLIPCDTPAAPGWRNGACRFT